MENQRELKWKELKEQLFLMDTEEFVCFLEYEKNCLQQEAFMQGYEYAITILQESIVKK